MDHSEIEESLFALGEPKLHGGMCATLSLIYVKVLAIFPDLEAARPRSTSGIQALCSLHIALEKTKTILQHCADCSKLYLAITGDSVVLKFEKTRSALQDSLKRVEDIVPQTIGCQISEIFNELEGIEFSLDPLEKQIGDEIIGLLQEGRNLNSSSDINELETFHQAASKLNITSSRGALRERRALKKLLEKSRIEDDKRKESIIAYLLHLMRKYSKLFRSDFSDDNDSQGGSTPCSPTVTGSGSFTNGFDRQLSKMSSFNFKPNFRKSGQMSVPPEELRCPISLQLMYDPVIIASGQTYERVCIEKWFGNGQNTCPKTRQQLSHLCLTPNYSVKGLVASWCEQNGVLVPEGPPDTMDVNYWNLSFTEPECGNTSLVENGESVNYEGEGEGDEVEVGHEDFLTVLDVGDEREKLKVVGQIRHLSKDDDEVRILMGENGVVEGLMRFFEWSVHEGNIDAQESVAMALFNLSVNNNRNKETMLSSGVLPLLDQMIKTSSSPSAVSALYLSLSSLPSAKPLIPSTTTTAIPFLIHTLHHSPTLEPQSDSLHALYHLSTHPPNTLPLLHSHILPSLTPLLESHTFTETIIAILTNMAHLAREEIVSTPGIITGLASVLDVGEVAVQEQAVGCLLVLCSGSERCVDMVLQEGVIPSLVSISGNGSVRGREKAEKLLMLFRVHRQREATPVDGGGGESPEMEVKVLSKVVSRRKMGRSWSSLWRNKSFLVHQC